MTNRVLLFSVGILLGVIAGGVVVFYSTGSSVKNIFVVKEERKKEIPAAKAESVVKPDVIKKTIPEKKESVKPATTPATIKTNPQRESEVLTFDLEEDIVVKTDELLKSYTVPLINSIPASEKDSTLEVVSGVKPSPEPKSIMVEYWKSPINYRGYKMNRNKLILYGIQEADDVKIVKTEEGFFMKHREKFYRLQFTSDFRPYEYVSEPLMRERIETL